MGPIRLILFFFWASVIYVWVTKREDKINQKTRGVFLLVGQNSLFVYIFHALVVLAFKFFIPAHTSIAENFLIVTLSLITVIGGTYAYRYFRMSRPEINASNLYNFIFKKGRSLFAAR